MPHSDPNNEGATSLGKDEISHINGFKTLDQVAEYLVWQAQNSVTQAIPIMRKIGRLDLIPRLADVQKILEEVALARPRPT